MAARRLLALVLILVVVFSPQDSPLRYGASLALQPRLADAALRAAPVLSITLPAVQNAGLIEQIQGGTQYYTATHTLSPGSLPFGSYTGSSGYTTYARSLIQFDLSSLPTGVSIQTATLVVSTSSWPANIAASGSIGAYHVTAAWNESITWTTQPAVDPGPVSSASLQTGQTGPYRWDVTSLAQSWQSSPSANHGVLLGSAPSLSSVIGWAGASAVRGSAAGPSLVVQYSLPDTPTPTATDTPAATATPTLTATPGGTAPPIGSATPTGSAIASPVAPSPTRIATSTPTAPPSATLRPTTRPAPTRRPAEGGKASSPEVSVRPTELDTGAELRTTITVTGTGTRAVSDVRLELLLPAGVSLLDARFAPEQSGWVSLLEAGRVEMVLGPEGRIEPGQVVAIMLLFGAAERSTTASVEGRLWYASKAYVVPVAAIHIIRSSTLVPSPRSLPSPTLSPSVPQRLPNTGGDSLEMVLLLLSLVLLICGYTISLKSHKG